MEQQVLRFGRWTQASQVRGAGDVGRKAPLEEGAVWPGMSLSPWSFCCCQLWHHLSLCPVLPNLVTQGSTQWPRNTVFGAFKGDEDGGYYGCHPAFLEEGKLQVGRENWLRPTQIRITGTRATTHRVWQAWPVPPWGPWSCLLASCFTWARQPVRPTARRGAACLAARLRTPGGKKSRLAEKAWVVTYKNAFFFFSLAFPLSSSEQKAPPYPGGNIRLFFKSENWYLLSELCWSSF